MSGLGIDPEDQKYVSRHQALTIAEQAGRAASLETLKFIGIDATTPAAAIEVQKDMAFLRTRRETDKDSSKKAKLVAIGIVMTTFLGLVLNGLEHTLKAITNG